MQFKVALQAAETLCPAQLQARFRPLSTVAVAAKQSQQSQLAPRYRLAEKSGDDVFFPVHLGILSMLA